MSARTPTTATNSRELACIPEWCEQDGESHDETCPKHPMEQTKGEFVTAARGGAAAAIQAYQFLISDGFSAEAAAEQAVDESEESAICFAGIGSCGRGWCKHG